MEHETLGGAICPNRDVPRCCSRCGWINPIVWEDLSTANLPKRSTDD